MINRGNRLGSLGDSGIEGLPLRLLIAMLVVAITVPIVWAWFDSYNSNLAESEARDQIEKVFLTANQIYFQGPGNRQIVEVDFRDHFGYEVERVSIGDSLPDGRNRSMASYEISGRSGSLMVIEPNIPLTSADNAPLVFGGGSRALMLSCEEGDFSGERVVYVEISVLE